MARLTIVCPRRHIYYHRHIALPPPASSTSDAAVVHAHPSLFPQTFSIPTDATVEPKRHTLPCTPQTVEPAISSLDK